MSHMRIFLSVLALLCILVWADASPADEPGDVLSIQLENDFFGGGTDRHFTHGTRIEYTTKPVGWITDWANRLPWLRFGDEKEIDEDSIKGRASFSIGQNMYTPENVFTPQLLLNDRPYAGWLYMGFGLVANKRESRYDKVMLEVGMIGPSSLAEKTQRFWHSIWGIHVPEGWDNQLGNEPGIVLYYEQARRYEKGDLPFNLQFDIIPHFGGSLGNVFTYASAGFILRLGPDLRNDFGPPRIRPSLPGAGYFRREKGLDYYLFAGFEGRAIIRNIFLDGNTFRDSHSVEKRLFVGDLQAGVTFQLDRFQVSYTQIYRTKEFKAQDNADIYGSMNLSYQF
jgi:lipid A 3-O-deacylase